MINLLKVSLAMAYNILQFVDNLQVGGAQQVIRNLVSAADRKSFNPLVATLQTGPMAEHIRRSDVPVFILKKGRSYDIGLLRSLIRLIKETDAHLIHCHLLVSSIYGFLGAKRVGIPVVVTVHGEKILGQKHGGRVFKQVLSRSEGVIAVSRDLREKLAEALLLDRNRIQVIHNGVDHHGLERDSKSSKQKLPFPRSAATIATVGTLSAVKAFPLLLRAFREVLREVPRARLVLIGDGPVRASLEKLSEELGIADSLVITGRRDDVPHLLGAVDVVASSSQTEGISMGLLEAMALGVPLVATEVGGNPEIIRDGENGLLVESGNEQELARALIDLLKSPTMRREMGEAGRRIVANSFSLRRMGRAYSTIYRQCLEGEKASS